MIAGPEHSRVAQVRSDGGNGLVTGSGYLVAPGLVVTASQVVRGAEKIKILLAQSDGNHANSDPMDARILSGMVAMIDDQVGVAVIALRPDAVAWPEMPPARLSNVPAADLGGASDVVAVGLLDQASLGGSRDFVRITGKVLHQEDRSSGTLTFEIDQKMLDTDGAPWTGMAGAPLWIDDQIIGVILAASRDRRALIAASSERVLANRDFVRLLESAGMREGGGLAEQGGELAEAESAAHRDAANADSIGFRELGRMAEQRGDLAGAERAYRQAADMGNSAAFRDLGHLSEQRGDLTNAERAYRQAADMGNSAAFRDLGHLSEQRGDLTNAERAYRQAADMGNSAAFRDLGHLSEQRGDLTNAERAYRQAADMGNSAARRDLTQLLERTGDSRRPDPLAEPAYPDRAESSGTTTIEADLRDEALGEVSDRSAAQLFGRLSPSSISALEYADALRIAARRDKIHMEHLLLGLSQKQDGPTRRLLERAGLGQAELLDVLAEAVGASFPPSIAPSHLDSLPPISKHAAEALERAVGLADSLDSQVVRSRHLFYGTLSVSGCSVVRLLAARGVRAADIENLATSGPPIAIADRPSLLPGAAADTVPEPGSGRVKSADKLDVAVDVEMLVSVLLARDTPLPLAVGLFGDWGSGKSFFMALMQERIDELAKLAKDRQPQAWPYCQEIRQVRFNAWHYVDTDLWASLAATLFDELARAGQADETQAKLKELDQARKKVVEARAERHRLEREVAELDAKVNRPIAAARAAVSAAIRAVRDEEKVSAKLRDVALADSPLDDSSPPRADDDSITQLADVLGVVDGPLGRAQVTWRLCKEEVLHRRRRTTIVTFAALILVAVIATMLTKWSAGATLLAVLGAAIAALTPALNGGLRVLYWAREAREARELPLVEKRGELAIARAAESAAEEEALQGKQELANARNKGLRLQELVRERAASSDYRDRLGVMSRVRRDFEDLVGLMPGGQPNGTDDGEDPDVGTRVAPQVPDVERIFLYVDDLDRCPHDKVVEVLQAVHLLLAFKLFVVVVGVDSRWLTRSLAAHYDNLLDEPDSYLEKIFQIPFALRRMTQQRYQDLIVALTPPPSPARETTDSHGTVVPPPEDAIEPSRIASVSQESPDKSYEVDNSEVEANPSGSAADPQADAHPTPPIEPETSEPALPRPEALSLTAPERSLLGQVSDFVPTPRAAKRLVNIYRMLRVSVPSDELEAFLPKTDSEVDRDGNEYQAVILLLGILIGRPAVSQHVFNSLTAAPPSTDIWQLLAPFEELNEPLRRLREHVTVGRIDAYQRWAPRVSRFSFRMAVVPP